MVATNVEAIGSKVVGIDKWFASVCHGCDKPQGVTGRGMEGWGQGMKKSTCEKPQPLWRVHG